jgi:hypothetical protein
MNKKTLDFSIVFEEMDRLRVEVLGEDGIAEINDYNEINNLRELVIESQIPLKYCLVTT